MTARIDTFVKAAAPVSTTGGSKGQARPAGSGLTPEERERRARERERIAAKRRERISCWQAISEAGGIDAWITQELRNKGVSTAPLAAGEELSDRDKAQYKDRKKAEAEERRRLRRQAWEAYHATHISHLGSGVHWQDGAEPDRFDVEHRSERARDNGMPELVGAEDLAKALGLSIPRLRLLTYHREADTGTNYYTFTIPKRDGTPRTLRAPKPDLKAAQRWMLRNVAERLPVHSAAHGFLPERSIVTNALVHAGAEVIVKLDLRDFFPTISYKRVTGLFQSYGLGEEVALPLPAAALPAVFRRYGRPLEEGVQPAPVAAADEADAPLWVPLAGGGQARLWRFQFLPYGWVHSADYLLWECAGSEPLAAPAPLVASALSALARAAAG